MSSPIRVFVLVLVLVFSAEGLIMLALPGVQAKWHGTVLEGFVDAAALTLITAPAVWFLLVLPLRRALEVRGHLLRRLFESQEQERSRLGRELHDGVGQNLTALLVGLRRVADSGDLETAVERARDLEEVASLAHGEVRALARGLHPGLVEELGLVVATERLCESFERIHGIPVVFNGPLRTAQPLTPLVAVALYRIVQEALANVARHASAGNVEVTLKMNESEVSLLVRDDGIGFGSLGAAPTSEPGFGLVSIRERSAMLGGICHIRSKAGRGTMIEVRVPVTA